MKSGRKLKEHKDKRFQQIVVKKDMTFLERQEMRNLVILRNQKREEALRLFPSDAQRSVTKYFLLRKPCKKV